jgi:hypothetical protein
VTLGSHQQAIGKSQNHITPRRFIDVLGPFGLDPCAADPRPWDCATVNWTEADDGLKREWPRHLFTWLNPPFDQFIVGEWILRLAQHGNGIALLHARTETEWFNSIWERASGILFLSNRIKFCKADGSEQRFNSGAPVILVAFGAEALARLRRCSIPGRLATVWEDVPARPRLTAVGGAS